MRKRKKGVILLILLLLIISGCTEKKSNIIKGDQQIPKSNIIESSTKLVEDRQIYEYDKDEPLVHLYVTILQSTDGKPYSFYDLNHWYHFNSIKSDSPSLDIIVQEGSIKGPDKGDLIVQKGVANSTIEIRVIPLGLMHKSLIN